ncbi:hypothetical protein ACTA71_001143 [Dictyostelium dimigraforme]
MLLLAIIRWEDHINGLIINFFPQFKCLRKHIGCNNKNLVSFDSSGINNRNNNNNNINSIDNRNSNNNINNRNNNNVSINNGNNSINNRNYSNNFTIPAIILPKND